MKHSLLSLSVLASGLWSCAASPYPELQFDPKTTKDCFEWYSNSENQTCEEVRDFFNATPEEFFEWNPSVGSKCDKLWIFASYCIMTNEKYRRLTVSRTTTTLTPTSTITKTSTTLGPSPTVWNEIGCYADRPTRSILDKLVSSKDGDASLTIPKCQDACYQLSLPFAGVKAGNECWCSGSVAGKWTPKKSDCNMPCTGDSKTTCGGKDCLNVFEALKPEVVPGPKISTSTQGITTTTGQGRVVQTTQADSGARRNFGLF